LPYRPTTDDALTIEPEPCATIVSATAWVHSNTPFRLTAITESNCADVIFASRASLVMPALLISTSMRPHSALTAATIASIDARSVTSTTQPERAAAGGADRRDRGLDALRSQVGDDHAGALAGEADGGRQADALGRAGDDGDFVGEAHDGIREVGNGAAILSASVGAPAPSRIV
jgi:hypothetical protein